MYSDIEFSNFVYGFVNSTFILYSFKLKYYEKNYFVILTYFHGSERLLTINVHVESKWCRCRNILDEQKQ